MNRLRSVASCSMVFILVPCASAAQQLYVSTESGLGIGNSLGTEARDTDFSDPLRRAFGSPQSFFSGGNY